MRSYAGFRRGQDGRVGMTADFLEADREEDLDEEGEDEMDMQQPLPRRQLINEDEEVCVFGTICKWGGLFAEHFRARLGVAWHVRLLLQKHQCII